MKEIEDEELEDDGMVKSGERKENNILLQNWTDEILELYIFLLLFMATFRLFFYDHQVKSIKHYLSTRF